MADERKITESDIQKEADKQNKLGAKAPGAPTTPAPTPPVETGATGTAVPSDKQPPAPTIPPGQSSAQGSAQANPEAKKDKGSSLKELKAGESYRIREDGATAWWWRRKYDGLPQVNIEGTIKETLGVDDAGALGNNSHEYAQLKDRLTGLPVDHPITKDWGKMAVGNVGGRRELVHPSEVEAL